MFLKQRLADKCLLIYNWYCKYFDNFNVFFILQLINTILNNICLSKEVTLNKKLYSIALLVTCLVFTGCSSEPKSNNETSVSTTNSTDTSDDLFTIETSQATIEAKFSNFDTTTEYSDETTITLNGSDVTIDGNGAVLSDKDIIISNEGHYCLSGTLNDGRIVVDASSEENVHLIFNNVTITSSNSAAVYIKSCNKTVITLANNSINQLSDGVSYEYDDVASEEPNACIFSADDLTINGNGSLIVEGNFHNGISSKDDLKIISGSINVKAVNNGLRGKDSVAIKSGTLKISCGKDGIKANNDTDIYKGYIYVESGNIDITAEANGLQAINAIKVIDGDISIESTKDSINCDGIVEIPEGVLY